MYLAIIELSLGYDMQQKSLLVSWWWLILALRSQGFVHRLGTGHAAAAAGAGAGNCNGGLHHLDVTALCRQSQWTVPKDVLINLKLQKLQMDHHFEKQKLSSFMEHYGTLELNGAVSGKTL